MQTPNTTWRRTLVLLVGLLGTVLIATGCAGNEPAAAPTPAPTTAQTTQPAAQPTPPPAAPRQLVTVKISDNTFETNWIENAIVKLIVEKGYGHKIEEVVLTTPGMQAALANGSIDLAIEFWPGNMQDWWDKEIAKGSIVSLGDIYGGGDQFFVIPKWVSDQYNVKSVEDMKRPEVAQLFKHPEDPKKGAFYNCIIGWQCAEINRTKFKAYGLDRYYNIISPGASAALDAAMVGPMKRKQPVFGYYWAPTSIYGAYDWYVLKEPAFTKECWDEVLKGRDDKNYTPKMACAYDTQPTLVVASKKFAQEGPKELLDFFKKINVGTAPVSQTAAWAVDNDIQGKWEKAAVYYLKTFEDRWKTWVPESVYLKVKAALAKAGMCRLCLVPRERLGGAAIDRQASNTSLEEEKRMAVVTIRGQLDSRGPWSRRDRRCLGRRGTRGLCLGTGHDEQHHNENASRERSNPD